MSAIKPPQGPEVQVVHQETWTRQLWQLWAVEKVWRLCFLPLHSGYSLLCSLHTFAQLCIWGPCDYNSKTLNLPHPTLLLKDSVRAQHTIESKTNKDPHPLSLYYSWFVLKGHKKDVCGFSIILSFKILFFISLWWGLLENTESELPVWTSTSCMENGLTF